MDTGSSQSLESAAYYTVYTGSWIDWSHGRILGATITLTRRNGAVLTAFLALFVTFVGTCFWRAACFILHSYYSCEAPRDGIYHQRQAILRNSANSVSGLWSFIQALWSWRRITNTHRLYLRLLPVLGFTVTIVCAFAAAGVLSSKVTYKGSEVLVSSKNCGFLRWTDSASLVESRTICFPYQSKRLASLSNYAQQCYNNNSKLLDCGLFVQESLSIHSRTNAPCPFDESSGLCRTNDSNIQLDSGYIDTSLDLGLNTPASKRLAYRAMLHCAPLTTKSHSKPFNHTTKDGTTRYMRYHLGRSPQMPGGYTYEHPEYVRPPEDTWSPSTRATADYSIGWVLRLMCHAIRLRKIWGMKYAKSSCSSQYSAREVAFGGARAGTFDPIPALNRSDIDLLLVFLSANSILFANQTDDLWYSAHIPAAKLQSDTASKESMVAYRQDEPASVLGCVYQQQLCNPNLPADRNCTPLGDALNMAQNIQTLVTDEIDFETVLWITNIIHNQKVDMAQLMNTLGVSLLMARYSLYGSIQAPLPDNQWQLEVENWFKIHLSSLQYGFVETATGPSDPQMLRFFDRVNDPKRRQLCKNQKIRNSAYTSFSTLGISIILCVGGLIIATSYALEPLVSLVQKRRNLDVYARLEWATNETLQLQRLAHEELGLGSWRRAVHAVPVTEDGREKLAMLDLADAEHPRLKAPPQQLDAVLGLTDGAEEKTTGEPLAQEVKRTSSEGDDVSSEEQHEE